MYPVEKSNIEYQNAVQKLLDKQFDTTRQSLPGLGVCFEAKYIRILAMSFNQEVSICVKLEPTVLDSEGSILRWIYTSHVFMVHGIPFCPSSMPLLEAGIWTTEQMLNYVDSICVPLLGDTQVSSLWDFVEMFPNEGISTRDMFRLREEHSHLEQRYAEIRKSGDDGDDLYGISITR